MFLSNPMHVTTSMKSQVNSSLKFHCGGTTVWRLPGDKSDHCLYSQQLSSRLVLRARRQWWWGHCLFCSPRVCCQGSRLARAVLTFITPRTGQLWTAINWRHYSPEPGHENHQNLLFPHSDNFAVHPSAVTGIIRFLNFYIDTVTRRRPFYMLTCKIENRLRLFVGRNFLHSKDPWHFLMAS